MTMVQFLSCSDRHTDLTSQGPALCVAAGYKTLCTPLQSMEIRLREGLYREETLRRETDALIGRYEILRQESEHRFLNGLQMIISLLSLQSRSAENVGTAAQLNVAANRVASIARVHRRLHYLDNVPTVAFRPFLEDLGRDFTALLSCPGCPDRAIVVEAIEVELPTATGIPLGFVVSELITNAAKYGKGSITIRLELHFQKGYALSVSDDGPAFSEATDTTSQKGLGMNIIRSLVESIGGELLTNRATKNECTQYVVLFS